MSTLDDNLTATLAALAGGGRICTHPTWIEQSELRILLDRGLAAYSDGEWRATALGHVTARRLVIAGLKAR